MSKSLAALNLTIFLVACIWFQPKTQNIIFFLIFVVVACVSLALRIYHDRNASNAAIGSIIDQLLAEEVLENDNAEAVSEVKKSAVVADLKSTYRNMPEDRTYRLTWELPLIGSITMLQQALRR